MWRTTHRLMTMTAVALTSACTQTQPLPWDVASDFHIDRVGTGYRMPVNIAFVPNPDHGPDAPLYYVAELYGSIQVVTRSGAKSEFATGLLDYNPQGPISGSGEQGLAGLAVERDAANPSIYHLYVTMLWDNGAPPGASQHYPKVELITSAAGGLTMASRTVLLNMQPETQGYSNQISSISIGPDSKLYVHVGDGLDASTALDRNKYRGKVLRMNKDGTPVTPDDAAGGNPFYNAADGISATDYIYTSGHRNAFGGAWRISDGRRYIVENGESIDRIVRLESGANYGWNGSDESLVPGALYIWKPAVAPVNAVIVQNSVHANSGFPAAYHNRMYVTQSGPTYAEGPDVNGSKCITEFSDLDSVGDNGQLSVPPRVIARYTGPGHASAIALAAGPDGLYFSDFYEDTGANGPTAAGANIYRLRYRLK